MRLRRPLAARIGRLSQLRWPRWPAGTVRTRLTCLYGALFLLSAGVLLVVVGVLWGNTTEVTVDISQPVPFQVLTLAGLAPPAFPGAPMIAHTSGGGGIIAGNSGDAPSGASSGEAHTLIVRAQVVKQLQLLAQEQHSTDLHGLFLWSGLALAGMALLSIALGWLMSGRVLRPLHRITRAARDISASNLHERLALEGPEDEFKELGDTFDQLLGRLERSFESQRRFVANASHELRTPLATMHASIDVALAKPAPVPEQTVALAGHLRQELAQVEELLESLLVLARAQAGAVGEEEEVALDGIAARAVAGHAPAIAAMGLEVEEDWHRRVPAFGNPTLLTRMVDNLVDNAIRHNVPGGRVRISYRRDAGASRLVVENSGPQIDEAGVRELAQPFRRLGPERTGSANGSGLGLSIVAAIAEAHHGHVELLALADGGLQAAVELPDPPARAGTSGALAGAAM